MLLNTEMTKRGVLAASLNEAAGVFCPDFGAGPVSVLKQAGLRVHALASLGLVILAAGCASAGSQSSKASNGVQLTQLDDRVRVEINGQLFTEYFFKGSAKPYFYPILGPGGAGMTRDWPMKETSGEEHDHPHHRGLWFGHGEVNGADVWTDKGENTGRVVHRNFREISSGKNTGVIVSRNYWVDAAGKLLCTDETTMRFYNPGDVPARWLDFELTLRGSNGDVLLGDTKEGVMSIRIAESMRLTRQTPKGQKPVPGDGRIVLSTGLRDAEAWGKRAEWCDYSGPVNGKTVGIAIFDHPQNPRHPTWWMVRDYGLFAANAFGQHEYEKTADPNAGDLKIPAGSSVTFQYRFLFHEGDAQQGRVAERFKEFTQSEAKAAR